MEPIQLAKKFLQHPGNLAKYNEAIAILKEAGFEEVIRRLGEPSSFALDDPNHFAMSAFEQAERRGWYQAVDCIFNFIESIESNDKIDPKGDYGAKEHLASLGYREEDINA